MFIPADEIHMLQYGIVVFSFNLSILALSFILQIWKKEWLIKNIKKILIFVIAVTTLYFSYIVYLQYLAFQAGMMRYIFFETLEGWKQFFSYVRMNIFGHYLTALLSALGFLIGANLLNKKCNERFFEKEEPYLGALAIFLIGYPGWIFYLGILTLIYLINHLVLMFKKTASFSSRLPIYYFWIPVAILVILIINFWFANFEWWSAFKF